MIILIGYTGLKDVGEKQPGGEFKQDSFFKLRVLTVPTAMEPLNDS